jgi:hypothetical protein
VRVWRSGSTFLGSGLGDLEGGPVLRRGCKVATVATATSDGAEGGAWASMPRTPVSHVCSSATRRGAAASRAAPQRKPGSDPCGRPTSEGQLIRSPPNGIAAQLLADYDSGLLRSFAVSRADLEGVTGSHNKCVSLGRQQIHCGSISSCRATNCSTSLPVMDPQSASSGQPKWSSSTLSWCTPAARTRAVTKSTWKYG